TLRPFKDLVGDPVGSFGPTMQAIKGFVYGELIMGRRLPAVFLAGLNPKTWIRDDWYSRLAGYTG
ncbi:MAG: hypothetical protein JSW12_21840, partial [Deltaproteobacteria bacterium]